MGNVDEMFVSYKKPIINPHEKSTPRFEIFAISNDNPKKSTTVEAGVDLGFMRLRW
jgi:hypothetical protein